MGSDTTFGVHSFAVSSENDGPAFLRHGAEATESVVSFDAAVRRFGKSWVALVLRQTADRLDPPKKEVLEERACALHLAYQQHVSSSTFIPWGVIPVDKRKAFVAAVAKILGGWGQVMPQTPEALAQRFHEVYERLAPSFGYKTREASAKPWAEVPENNRKLMTAVCEELLSKENPDDY